MTIRLIPAVLSGGSGSRLWPLSTDALPKQFHALASEKTMIQETVRRLISAADELIVLPPLLVCSGRHEAHVRDQMEEIGGEPAAVVLEPFGRNSAPAAAVAARLAYEMDTEALVVLMAADHVLGEPEAFHNAIARSVRAAEDNIVVFGVTPTGPETGYGYIESGEVIDGDVRKVVGFAEKPDLATAQAYVAGGRHLWNAGIFLFKPAVLLAEMQRLAPEVLAASDAALAASRRSGAYIHLNEAAFAACPSISLDYAVMEKTDRAAMIPIGSSWADVGSWSELWRLGPRDAQDNFVRGDGILIDTEGSLVWAENKTVGVIGVKDLIVVQTGDAVIVLPKSRAQEVKLLVEQIKARALRSET
jgi:mannose-1-phosphate guanylyltransferase/mannose-6-phosphate isomerase